MLLFELSQLRLKGTIIARSPTAAAVFFAKRVCITLLLPVRIEVDILVVQHVRVLDIFVQRVQ